MEEKKEPEIKSSTKWLMLCVAIFFDIISLLSLIPVVGWILGVFVWLIAFMTFWFWFSMHGINIFSYRNPKKMIASIISNVVEITPLGFLPAWTILIIYLTRVEKVVNKIIPKI